MPLDRHNPVVRKFIQDVETLIERNRDGLERKGKTHEDVIFLQGEIKAYRKVIDLATDTGDDDA